MKKFGSGERGKCKRRNTTHATATKSAADTQNALTSLRETVPFDAWIEGKLSRAPCACQLASGPHARLNSYMYAGTQHLTQQTLLY